MASTDIGGLPILVLTEGEVRVIKKIMHSGDTVAANEVEELTFNKISSFLEYCDNVRS